MLQNAGFGTIPWGGRGGVVANREPGSYIADTIKTKIARMFKHKHVHPAILWRCTYIVFRGCWKHLPHFSSRVAKMCLETWVQLPIMKGF